MARLFRFVPPKYSARALESGIVSAVSEPLDRWTTILLSLRQYFRPYAAPASSLDWLMSLVSLPDESSLSDARKRALADVAWRVWPRKGVTEAIRWWIWALAGIEACVESRPNTAFVAGWSKTGIDPTVDRVDEVGPGALAHWYDICIPAALESELPVAEVRRLVAHVAPVYAFFDVAYETECQCLPVAPGAPVPLVLGAPTITAAPVSPAVARDFLDIGVPATELYNGPYAMTAVGYSAETLFNATGGFLSVTVAGAVPDYTAELWFPSGTVNAFAETGKDHFRRNQCCAEEGAGALYGWTWTAGSYCYKVDLTDGTVVDTVDLSGSSPAWSAHYSIDVNPADFDMLLVTGGRGLPTGTGPTVALIDATDDSTIAERRPGTAGRSIVSGCGRFNDAGDYFVTMLSDYTPVDTHKLECYAVSGFGLSATPVWTVDLEALLGTRPSVTSYISRDGTNTGWWCSFRILSGDSQPYLYHIDLDGNVDVTIDLRTVSGISGIAGKDAWVYTHGHDAEHAVYAVLRGNTGSANPAPTVVSDILKFDAAGTFKWSSYAYGWDGAISPQPGGDLDMPANINALNVDYNGIMGIVDNSGYIRFIQVNL